MKGETPGAARLSDLGKAAGIAGRGLGLPPSLLREAMDLDREKAHARAVLGCATLWDDGCTCTVVRSVWDVGMGHSGGPASYQQVSTLCTMHNLGGLPGKDPQLWEGDQA